MTRVKVVDASAVVALAFNEPARPRVAELLDDSPLVAPTLLRYEVANVCTTKMRRDPSHRHELMAMFGVFSRMDISLMQVDHGEIVQLAHRFGLSGHDASYLWLAQSLDAELITLDRQLADAAAALR